ncbi:MAG: NADH-quinone oxidoreductase subunit L [Nitrospirae bacterium]|nr:NADH-quinone oxidoreductase subunit L [Nitrospirota bacterium]
MVTYALIPLLPLVSFIVVGLFQKWFRNQAHLICVPMVFLSFALSLTALFDVAQGNTVNVDFFEWIPVGSFNPTFGVMVDQLTASMLVLVTLVSSLVHLYTVGYMHGDKGYDRFFAYISLFTFSMLVLVTSNNFLQLFFGWEAVGLCSYLLIVHWYERKASCNASLKAFIQNRVGDFGFAIGIFLIWVTFDSVDYQTVFAAVPEHLDESVSFLGWEVNVMTMIALLLFVGAVGKSAQFLLHSWLPDAMEGPTPISALIHAATMVTAGIFMVSRCHPIFNASEVAMMTVAIVGGFTALFGATIALTQNDIKKVVAYSTMSQLGYMVMACGIGAYAAGMFHLLTHGVFKALLFLAAGSVIHALAGEQDIRRMGQAKRHMPTTYWTMLWGSLALAGIFPFAGFFSKDEILWQAWNTGMMGKGLWLVGIIVAFMTAFYTFRVFFLVFYGADNMDHEVRHHAHESPKVITIPLVTLAIGSLLVGWLGQPFWGKNPVHEYMSPVFQSAVSGTPALQAHATPLPDLVTAAFADDDGHGAPAAPEAALGAEAAVTPDAVATPEVAMSAEAVVTPGAVVTPEAAVSAEAVVTPEAAAHPVAAAAAHGEEAGHGGHDKGAEFALMALSMLVAVSGIWMAHRWYGRPSQAPSRLAAAYQTLYQGSLNKWYWDELYDAIFTRPTLRLANRMWRVADDIIIDKVLVDGVAITTRITGEILKFFQTGRVQHYAMVMSLGIFVIVGGFFLF